MFYCLHTRYICILVWLLVESSDKSNRARSAALIRRENSALLPHFIRGSVRTSQFVCRDKNFSHHICYKNSKVLTSQERRHGHTELKNMLVMKSVLN